VRVQLLLQIGVQHRCVSCKSGEFWVKKTRPTNRAQCAAVGRVVSQLLDLANHVQRGSQSGIAFFPLGRADFAGGGGNVLGSLDLAEQVGSVTADTCSSDFNSLDDAFRVDNESTAVGQTHVFTHVFDVASHYASRVADHGVLDLADGFGAVVPCFVGEVGVGGDGVDFHAQLLQLFIMVGNVTQLSRANEGEVSRIEEEYSPLAFHVGVGNGDEFAVLERLSGKRLDFGIDNGH